MVPWVEPRAVCKQGQHSPLNTLSVSMTPSDQNWRLVLAALVSWDENQTIKRSLILMTFPLIPAVLAVPTGGLEKLTGESGAKAPGS